MLQRAGPPTLSLLPPRPSSPVGAPSRYSFFPLASLPPPPLCLSSASFLSFLLSALPYLSLWPSSSPLPLATLATENRENLCGQLLCESMYPQVIKALPSLTKLDNEEIKQEERERVASMDLPPLPRPSEAMTHAQSNPNPQGLDFRCVAQQLQR